MGTGSTGTGSCRIGTANVGDLINAYTGRKDIDYQRKMCSGDTTTGLNKQIDGWTNPKNADIATVTMGGNDLGFSDLVMNCVLVPWSWHFESTYKKMCEGSVQKANRMLEDDSKDGIEPQLAAAYKRIVEKSTRSVSISPCYCTSLHSLFDPLPNVTPARHSLTVRSGLPCLRLRLS